MKKTVTATQKKYRVGDYRLQRFKMDRDGRTGSIHLACWMTNDNPNMNSIGAVTRHLNGLWRGMYQTLDDMGLKQLIFVPELPDTIAWDAYSKVHCRGFVQLTLQFTSPTPLDRGMNEPCWDVVEGILIGIVESSKLEVVNK